MERPLDREGEAPAPDADASGPSSPWTSERWAAVTAGVAAVVAFPVIMYLGRDQWFFLDEWAFLAARDGGSLDSLLQPHNEHWVSLPVVTYRVLHRIVGLNAYWPYQALAVTVHLAVAVVLRVVMRRAGVHPWIATAAAVLFMFLGAGRTNISYAFQVGFTGGLLLGLLHLLLSLPASEGDSGSDRTWSGWRDAVGIALGLLALTSTGVGVAMAGAVGVAVLIGRGWRAALLHTVPLGAVYLLWYLGYGADAVKADTTASPAETLAFAARAVGNGFHALGQVPGVGFILGLLALLGTGVAARSRAAARLSAGPLGLAAGAWTFMLVTGYGRAALPDGLVNPREPRYLYLVAALVLPVVAVGASWIATRARWGLVVVLVLLLAGLPANVAKLEPKGAERLTLGDPGFMSELADRAVATRPPRNLHPLPDAAPEVSVGWLIDEREAGRIGPPGRVSRKLAGSAALALSLRQVSGPAPGRCERAPTFFAVRLGRGQVLTAPEGSGVVVVDERTGGRISYSPDPATDRTFVRVEADELTALVGSSSRGERARVCR